MSDERVLQQIREEVEYLCAKRLRVRMISPRVVIIHWSYATEKQCRPGETIESAYLAFPAAWIRVGLSPTALIIADCLVRYRRSSLTASRMEHLFRADPFYRRLGANALGSTQEVLAPKRSSIKVYIDRMRAQFAKALLAGGSDSCAQTLLASDRTDSNVVTYRFTVATEICHENPGYGIENEGVV